MKRTVFYKTHWSNKEKPFVCKLADKPHRPKVKVWMVTPAGFRPIPYKKIDELMYETKDDTFEKLAEETAKKIVSKIEGQGQKGEIRVTVNVREDRGFWVEAVEEKTLTSNELTITVLSSMALTMARATARSTRQL